MSEKLFAERRCLAEVVAEVRDGDGLAHHVFEQANLLGALSERDEVPLQMVACRRCSTVCGVNFDDEFDGKLHPSDVLDSLYYQGCGKAEPQTARRPDHRRLPVGYSMMLLWPFRFG